MGFFDTVNMPVVQDASLGAGQSPFSDAAGVGASAAVPASWWQQAGTWLGSREGQSALSRLGPSLLGAAGQANPQYLRIAAQAPPFSQGGSNSLLGSILQMQLQQQQQRQFPLGANFRASLLG